MHNMTVRRTCLNGWWDFIPLYTEPTAHDVPRDGWLRGKYLVPSFWTKSTHGVRKRGETYFDANDRPEVYESDEYEFLFDGFGYPAAWSKTRSGWVRRTLEVAPEAGRSYWLAFEGVMPWATLFVNGQEVCRHLHPTLPLEVDVTDYLHAGWNEIAVHIEDYARDAKGRALTPTGNTIPCDHSGIWQDVWLVERGAVTLSDITLRTSTRTGTLTAIFAVSNATAEERDVTIAADVLDWQRGCAPEASPVVRTLPAMRLHVPAGGNESAEITVAWPEAEWWSPEHPKLYQIRTILIEGDTPLEVSYERFGFREVWIEGADLMLNDHPMHLFSDWGHKSTPYYTTEGWIRQWFGMIRDANMNHTRLHTHPHPPLHMELADELGILITGEAGLHGAGGAQAGLSPEYWEAAREHVRRFVKRDKNHPSVILWSVENEMRWNTKGRDAEAENAMIKAELPKLRALFNEIDPRRPAYHDGDSSLWNERTQPIISRHYGKECAGIGWWDQTQPLHSGEMALYHYAGPNNTVHLGGDATYASFKAIDEAAAEDAALIIETGRTLGVCCFGPWNLSCLENLRMETEKAILSYPDYTAPGVKPLQVPAHSSEFSFWKEGAGYTPNASFAIQRRAFRPLAVIDRSLKSAYFTGATFRRELFIANDTTGTVDGELRVSLGDDLARSTRYAVHVERGRAQQAVFEVTLPDEAGAYEYRAQLVVEGEVREGWARTIKVASRQLDPRMGRRMDYEPVSIAVYGPGILRPALDKLGISFAYIDSLDAENLSPYSILILERNTVHAGSAQNTEVQAFVRRGGRAIVLEQTVSLFPKMKLEDKPVLKAFVRAARHPVMEGLRDEDFAFWGEDPYPLLASDAYVARKLYRKDDGSAMLPLLDSGEGGFGSGNLEYTPLFEAIEGDGLILACQLRLTEKLDDTPTAEAVFLALLHRAASYQPQGHTPFIELHRDTVDAIEPYVRAARRGATVIVTDLNAETLPAWSAAVGVDLIPCDTGEVYQAVRASDDPLLAGVSNWDTCGIETYSYAHNVANVKIGSLFLAPAAGLEPLLVTPTESCLKELFVYGGRSEALRAHTLSRFLYGEKPGQAVVTGRVRVGDGAVIFNQFAPPAGQRERYARLRNRMLASLGWRCVSSLLEGELAESAASGAGYPQLVYLYTGLCDEDMQRQMVESTRPTLERMLSMPILNLAGWAVQKSEGGVWTAGGRQPGRAVYIYYPIWSPAPRKNIDTNLNVPNPEALTFLDFTGSGTVTATLNGQTHAPLSLDTGSATLSDLELEMGGNHVLIRWEADQPDATLAMRWRNIMHQPETGLNFSVGGSAD